MSLILGILYISVIGAVAVSMTVLLLKGKKEFSNIMYMICQGMVILWCCSQILILLSKTDNELAISYILGNIGICFIGCCWYYFAVLYVGSRFSMAKKLIPAMLSLFHFIMVVTNNKHHLYYAEFSANNIEHGMFFYSNVVTTYILVVLGAVLLYRNIIKNGDNKSAKALIIASVLIPVLMNLVYLTGIIKVSFDITPLGFAVSGIFVLLATIKYRFLEVNITAFDVILSDVSDGVAIFAKNSKCTYINKAFCELLDIEEKRLKRINISLVLNKISELDCQEKSELLFSDENGRYIQIQIYQSDKAEMKQISIEQLQENNIIVFMAKDMSRYYELLKSTRELAVANERLILEQERNRIAQQVHDTAGHTLTMIQSYMKLAAVSNNKNENEKVGEYLEEAKQLSSQGIRELRQSINQLRRQAEFELVTQGVMQLAQQVKEISVEVTVQGEDSEKYSHLSKILYDCVRETITNTLKYANATKMEIVLRFNESVIELIIGDDGQGCESIKENNGIQGIRERIEKANGTVKFISGIDEGFLTRIRVPI